MQNRRDEDPNKELAKEIVTKKDKKGMEEIAKNLWNEDKNIQSDCIGVFEYIGHMSPELIEKYVSDFLKLLESKNNRLIWGSMIALSTIADKKHKEIFDNLDNIVKVINEGSVITRDNGIKILAAVASVNEKYNKAIFPFLIEHLKRCRPKDVPQHAESIFVAINSRNKKEYIDVLHERQNTLKTSQSARIKKLFKRLETI